MDFGNVLSSFLPGGSPLSLMGPQPSSKDLISQALMGPAAGLMGGGVQNGQVPSTMSGVLPLSFLNQNVMGNGNKSLIPG